MIVLDVNGIGKTYKTYRSELSRIFSWFGLKSKATEEATTLKNISFSMQKGEAIGIIGQNGAGKSTLLKIITGTLKPTTGSVAINGRISAILELGMGFYPDLTGRQNAYHSAGLMGFTHEQIDAVIQNIEEFAEIGEYFDKPVRLYSSGMQVRVAFAVATAYRPEVLIIDEALSVGDAYFQHKSFAKIKQFREEGTSLLFVSHDKAAVLALCNKAILLEKGNLIKEGEPEEICDYYNALIAEKENSTIIQKSQSNGRVVTMSGTNEATIEDICLLNLSGDMLETVNVGEAVTLRVIVKINQDIPNLTLGYMIKDRLGQSIFGINTNYLHKTLYDLKSEDKIVFEFNFNANFGEGSYSITAALHADDNHLGTNYSWIDCALIFNIVNISKNKFVGLAWVEPELNIIYER